MPRTPAPILPRLEKRLSEFGERLKQARLRRRLSADMVAQRAGISLPTLRSIERGAPTCSIGAVVNVMFVLGFDADLDGIATQDELGRLLQDRDLPARARAPKR